MSQWTNGDYEPGRGRNGGEGGSGGRPRVLYWWPPPVGSERSAEVGGRMLKGTLVWLAVFAALLVIVGVYFAVTG